MDRRRIVTILAVLGGWSILAVLFTPQHYVLSRDLPDAPHWTRLLRANLAMFWVWAALTPLILWYGRRFPIERPKLAFHLLMHLLGGFAFSLLHIGGVRYVNAFMRRSHAEGGARLPPQLRRHPADAAAGAPHGCLAH